MRYTLKQNLEIYTPHHDSDGVEHTMVVSETEFARWKEYWEACDAYVNESLARKSSANEMAELQKIIQRAGNYLRNKGWSKWDIRTTNWS